MVNLFIHKKNIYDIRKYLKEYKIQILKLILIK